MITFDGLPPYKLRAEPLLWFCQALSGPGQKDRGLGIGTSDPREKRGGGTMVEREPGRRKPFVKKVNKWELPLAPKISNRNDHPHVSSRCEQFLTLFNHIDGELSTTPCLECVRYCIGKARSIFGVRGVANDHAKFPILHDLRKFCVPVKFFFEQCVARKHVQETRGEALPFPILGLLDLCEQFEAQTQLTNLDRLWHDLYPIEIAG